MYAAGAGPTVSTVASVDVWWADPTLIDGARLVDVPSQASFSAAERERYERLRRDQDKTLYLAAHLNVRAALARATRTRAREWRIEYDGDGHPFAVGPNGMEPPTISIAHTRGLVACALSFGGPVGIDVEPRDRHVDAMELARRHFSPREAGDLATCAEPQRTQRFLQYWSLKEACLKAEGIGLGAHLRDVEIDLTPAGDAAALRPHPVLSAGRRWMLRVLSTPRGYVASLALTSRLADELELRCNEATAADLLGHESV